MLQEETVKKLASQILAWCGLLAFFPGYGMGQEADSTRGSEARLEYRSKYILSNGHLADAQPVLHAQVGWPAPFGLKFRVWGSKALFHAPGQPQYGDEVDITVAYAWQTERSGTFEAGATYIMVSDLGRLAGDLVYAHASLENPLGHNFALLTQGELYVPTKGGQPRAGFFIRTGVSHGHRLFGFLLVRQTARAVIDSGAFGKDEALLLDYDRRTGVLIGGLEAGLSFTYSLPLTPLSAEDGRDKQTVWGLYLSRSF